MSKYDPLWNYLAEQRTSPIKLTFAEVEQIAGVKLDHSFLRYKKELLVYGWRVDSISMKAQSIVFEKQTGAI